MKNQLAQISNFSLVIEYEILADKELLFEQWQSELRSAVSRFKGYLNTDIFPPAIGVRNHWGCVAKNSRVKEFP